MAGAIIVPNPEEYLVMVRLAAPQIVVATDDNAAIREEIKRCMRIERAIADFCNGHITIDQYFDIAEQEFGTDQMDTYCDEIGDATEAELIELFLC